MPKIVNIYATYQYTKYHNIQMFTIIEYQTYTNLYKAYNVCGGCDLGKLFLVCRFTCFHVLGISIRLYLHNFEMWGLCVFEIVHDMKLKLRVQH